MDLLLHCPREQQELTSPVSEKEVIDPPPLDCPAELPQPTPIQVSEEEVVDPPPLDCLAEQPQLTFPPVPEEEIVLEVWEPGEDWESEDSEDEVATEVPAVEQEAEFVSRRAEGHKLRSSNGRYMKKYKETRRRVAELQREIENISETYKQALEERDQHIKAVEDELMHSRELSNARSTELSVAQQFLSTRDNVSEAEVLGLVQVLNENIFQVAANLTEEWEKRGASRSPPSDLTKKTVEEFSRYYGFALIHKALERDPAAVTYLIQTCLCLFVADVVLSWRPADGRRSEELGVLGSIYSRLSATEGQTISARWRSLTHSNFASFSQPLGLHQIAKDVANVLWVTGTFSSIQRSYDFVKTKGINGMETIHKLATRLESVFMVDVTSSDLLLLCPLPGTPFDGQRMSNEFDPDEAPTQPRRQDRVAGTIEVGVQKLVHARRGGSRRTEILLKAKIVLERDIVELEKIESAEAEGYGCIVA